MHFSIDPFEQHSGITVMITTHYIDEAKQSNLVGFLKEGTMLAEESPKRLMDILECPTLEEVFYKLCILDNPEEEKNHEHFMFHDQNNNFLNEEKKYIEMDNAKPPLDDQHEAWSTDRALMPFISLFSNNSSYSYQNSANMLKAIAYKQKKCATSILNKDHLNALVNREVTIFKANISSFLITQLIPVISLWLFFCTYGRTPHGIPVAIYNDDTLATTPNNNSFLISDIFLEHFDNGMTKLNYMPSEAIAFETVKRGHNFMAICFRKTFSSSFLKRYMSLGDTSSATMDLSNIMAESTLHIYTDVSHLLNIRYLNQSILLSIQETVKTIGRSEGVSSSVLSVPLVFQEIYHGKLDPDFQSLFTAGVILLMMLGINMLNAALKVNKQINKGCLDRDLNQGVKPNEFLLSIHLSLMFTALTQVIVIILFSFYVLEAQMDGSIWNAFFITLVVAINGVMIGSLVSVLFKSHIAILVSSLK